MAVPRIEVHAPLTSPLHLRAGRKARRSGHTDRPWRTENRNSPSSRSYWGPPWHELCTVACATQRLGCQSEGGASLAASQGGARAPGGAGERGSLQKSWEMAAEVSAAEC